MAREIEILFAVTELLESALHKLQHLHVHGVKETLDIYYTHAGIPKLHAAPDGRLVECLRIREKGGKAFLTHKKDHFQTDGTWTHSDEEETPVSDAKEMMRILSALGFQELVRIDNKKHTFTNEDYEIVLEDVKELGVFLEVEAKHPRGDVEEEKEKIRAVVQTLSIAIGEELNAGKPELLLKKRSART